MPHAQIAGSCHAGWPPPRCVAPCCVQQPRLLYSWRTSVRPRPGSATLAESPATGSSRIAFAGVAADPGECRGARERLLPWWSEERLARARIVVAGAGAIGNELVKNLALAGAGRVLVIDLDTVSPSNLSRSVLFRDGDVGLPKAQVVARRAMDLNPAVTVIPVVGDLRRDLALSTLRSADLILGALDNIEARFTLNRRSHLAATPYIDAGISDSQAQVSRFVPGAGACYECVFTEGMRRRFTERYSCTGLVRRAPDRTVPTTIVGAAVAAALQVQDALRWLHDPATGLAPGQRVTVLLDAFRQFVDDLPEDPNCLAHAAPAVPSLLLEDGPAAVSPAMLAVAAGDPAAGVDLGFDLVESFRCPACGSCEPVCRPAALVFEDEAICPGCGGERQVTLAAEILPGSPARDRPLAALGVAPREILRTGTTWVELGGPDPWAPPAG
ncbi:MAG: ThiF family adenylyltransferase [Chloroflexota bacterium]